MTSESLNSYTETRVKNESTINPYGTCFYWSHFIHDGLVYINTVKLQPLDDTQRLNPTFQKKKKHLLTSLKPIKSGKGKSQTNNQTIKQ